MRYITAGKRHTILAPGFKIALEPQTVIPWLHKNRVSPHAVTLRPAYKVLNEGCYLNIKNLIDTFCQTYTMQSHAILATHRILWFAASG